MVRALVSLFAILIAGSSQAQAPQFKWAAGQTQIYKVAQVTTATEVVNDKTSQTQTKLDLVKKWHVSAVDANGVATLTMSLDKLRMETKSPNGETMNFDSDAKDKSTPALVQDMAKFVGPALITVRLDRRGQLVEVKECKFGSPSRLEAELPFKIVLPATPFVMEGAWERKYQIKFEADEGPGTSLGALQKFKCKSINGWQAVIDVTTTLDGVPDDPADQIPLIPLQPSGEIVFDTAAGRVKSVRYKWSKDIAGHQGEKSKYSFATSYVEELQ